VLRCRTLGKGQNPLNKPAQRPYRAPRPSLPQRPSLSRISRHEEPPPRACSTSSPERRLGRARPPRRSPGGEQHHLRRIRPLLVVPPPPSPTPAAVERHRPRRIRPPLVAPPPSSLTPATVERHWPQRRGRSLHGQCIPSLPKRQAWLLRWRGPDGPLRLDPPAQPGVAVLALLNGMCWGVPSPCRSWVVVPSWRLAAAMVPVDLYPWTSI